MRTKRTLVQMFVGAHHCSDPDITFSEESFDSSSSLSQQSGAWAHARKARWISGP